MERKTSRKERNNTDEVLAPGLDGVEGLNEDASAEEIAEGESTEVFRLRYDEYDPSDD